MKSVFLVIILWAISGHSYAQRPIVLLSHKAAASILGPVPEHGYKFLKPKVLKYYSTIDSFNFGGKRYRVELYDNREALGLHSTNCSTVPIDNQSEYAGDRGAVIVTIYLQKLLNESNIVIDSSARDTLQVSLEALDCRLLGHGYITPHGLCQITIKMHDFQKTYCRDITDKDPQSPISRWSVTTRSTGTRIMTSAAIREVIEQFLEDLKKLE